MDDLTKDVNDPSGVESALNAGLERLIDGDVTCWGIDDAVAYGLKVAAMGRETCAKIAESLKITINGRVTAGGSFGLWVAAAGEELVKLGQMPIGANGGA